MQRSPLLFLLLVARAGLAQAPAEPKAEGPARWAVGAQAAFYPRFALADASIDPGGNAYVRPWPLLLTLSYRFGPRPAAVEAGLLLRIAPSRTTFQTSGTATYATTTRAATWAVPLLVRARVAPAQPRPWQLDATVGLMPLSTRWAEETTSRDNQTGETYVLGKTSRAYGDAPLVVGLGGTYLLSPHLSLTADARLTWSILLTIVGQLLLQRQDYLAPVAPAFSTGLSYEFGKPIR